MPRGLSMLWEQVEPEAALQERFGFADVGAAATWTAGVLAETWDVAVVDCPRMVISDQNAIVWAASDRGDLVVKWSRARPLFPSLESSTRLLHTVAARGIPVAAPLSSLDGRTRVVLDGPAGELSVAVLPQLPGSWLDVRDAAAVRSAGACLAHLHRALVASDPDLPHAPSPAFTLRARLDWWIAEGDRGHAPDASRRLAALVADAPELDDEPQLVHNDFRAANVLMRGSEVVGVLDFDDVVVDHRVHDLAKASVYLGTRFTGWMPTPTPAKEAFRAGYESVSPLSPAEARWFEILLLWHGIQAIPGPDDPAGWAAAL